MQDIGERHQRSAAQRLAHLSKVSQKAGDESKKVREVMFIQELKTQDRMFTLLEKLEDGEARRLEHLAAVRERQRDTDAAMEQATERRRQLEQERKERLAMKERRKADAQAKLMEGRRAEQLAREARSEQQRLAAEERAAAEAKVAQERSERLEERLREADNRRLLYLEYIKERATSSKEDRREQQPSPLPSPSPTSSRQHSAPVTASGRTGRLCPGAVDTPDGGHELARSSDGSVRAAKSEANRKRGARRRAKKLARLLQETPAAFQEPPHVAESLAKYQGGERCAHWRCATAKLQRLSETGETALLEELVCRLVEGARWAAEPGGGEEGSAAGPLMEPEEAHAARIGGALCWVAAHQGCTPRPGWSSLLELRLLQLWRGCLGAAEGCLATLSEDGFAGLIRRAAVLLEEGAASSRAEAQREEARRGDGGGAAASNASPLKQPSSAKGCGGGGGAASSNTDGDVLEAALAIIARVLDSACPEGALRRRHGIFTSLAVSSGVVKGLHGLFAAFDLANPTGGAVPAQVEAGLALLQALTGHVPPQPMRWPLCNSAARGDNVQALVVALKEERLAGLTSLLTNILLRASRSGSIAMADAVALPCNFLSVALMAFRTLCNALFLDVEAIQGLLRAPDLCMEVYHLVSYLLRFCLARICDEREQATEELLDEVVLFVGLFVVCNPRNQDVLLWGKSPTILQLLCEFPSSYIRDPLRLETLLPTLLSVCYDNHCLLEVNTTGLFVERPLLPFFQDVLESSVELPDQQEERSFSNRHALENRFPRELWQSASEQLCEHVYPS
uniref:S phase cyclin a-associated protein in the endoplasmic reticulum n=3 Tax=Tetraselmis sp. GSL018 TaxID=582737 RepID=A0A061SCW1_9CHLO